MSTLAGTAPAAAVRVRARRGRAAAGESIERLLFRAAAFVALGAFAALQYAALIAHAPTMRVLGAVAVAAAGGVLLALSSRAPLPRVLAPALGALLVLATGALALLVIGVPAGELRPAEWGRLAHHVSHGVSALHGWLWPYRGGDRWARLAVLLVIPAALVFSGCVSFWPARRGRLGRSLAALATLLALYITGLVNTQSGSASGFHGVALLALVVAWLWAPTIATSQLTRAAGWLLLCAVLGLIAAPALSSSEPWIDYRDAHGAAAGSATFQWDELYGPLPWRSSATMFELQAPSAALVRVTSLDRFDGLRFLRSDEPPGSAVLDDPQPGNAAWQRHEIVQLLALSSTLLPGSGGGAPRLRWLAVGTPPSASVAADGTIELTAPAAANSLYAISAYAPQPSAGMLRHAPATFPRAYLPYTQFALPAPDASALRPVDLAAEARSQQRRAETIGAPAPGRTPAQYPQLARRIEASPYARMFALAKRLAAGARSSYEVALSMQRYLLSNYTYDENVAQARYPLEAFLFSQRRGYCQQFSGAMALMLRMDGIPARIGAGFKPTLFDSGSAAWQVRAVDAHTWVEVFFSGIGWVSFDPTPPRPSAKPSGSSALLAKGSLLRSRAAAAGGPASRAGRVSRALKPAGGFGPLTLAGLALLGLLVLALALAWLRARRRLRAGLAGGGAGAVAELGWALERLRYPLAPGTTLARLEAQLAADPPARRQRGEREAQRYLAALRDLRYRGPLPPATPTPRGRAALRAALARRCGRFGRLRALLALPPGCARRASVTPPSRRGPQPA